MSNIKPNYLLASMAVLFFIGLFLGMAIEQEECVRGWEAFYYDDIMKIDLGEKVNTTLDRVGTIEGKMLYGNTTPILYIKPSSQCRFWTDVSNNLWGYCNYTK